MLAKDCLIPWEPLNNLIHYMRGMHLLSWIQRWRWWRLSAVRCTHYSNHLILWRGGHAEQGLIARGVLGGVFAWRRRQARISSGGQCFTVVIVIRQGECGSQVVVVDSFNAVFGVQVKEGFGGLVRDGFCALPQSPQVKCLLIPGSSLKVFNILIFFFLLWVGECVCRLVPVAVLNLFDQGGIAGFLEQFHEEFLREGGIAEEVE